MSLKLFMSDFFFHPIHFNKSIDSDGQFVYYITLATLGISTADLDIETFETSIFQCQVYFILDVEFVL